MNKVARSNLIPASSRLMDNSMVRFASALKAEKVGSEKLIEAIKNFFVLTTLSTTLVNNFTSLTLNKL